MTCIVGLEHNGQVYIGGDSAGVAGWSLTVRSDSKVFTRDLKWANGARAGEMVVGFTSSFRMGQIVRHILKVPRVPSGAKDWGTAEQAETWLVAKFIPALRECFEAEGFQKKTNERAEGGTFLVGIAGHLFCVDSDYQVGRAVCGYDAVGCGQDVANGAMHAWTGDGIGDPTLAVTGALTAAESHSAGVRGPFNVVVA